MKMNSIHGIQLKVCRSTILPARCFASFFEFLLGGSSVAYALKVSSTELSVDMSFILFTSPPVRNPHQSPPTSSSPFQHSSHLNRQPNSKLEFPRIPLSRVTSFASIEAKIYFLESQKKYFVHFADLNGMSLGS
jgi:hypothetical protein